MQRRWWMVLMFLLGIGVAAGGIALWVRQIECRFPMAVLLEPFDAAVWRSGNATQRVVMARQLIAGGDLIGLGSADIIAMLGPPRPGADDRRMSWFLGERKSSASMMLPYREYLILELDERGVCEKAYIFNLD